MNILVLNCGSSSLKFQVIETNAHRISQDSDVCLAKGNIERIGSQALIKIKTEAGGFHDARPIRNHKEAIDFVLKWCVSAASGLSTISSLKDIAAVGHRVVHGGERFSSSVRINEEVLRGIEECSELAPLHNPANLHGVRAISEIMGEGVPQVAVFDTAFHCEMPESAYLYAIPYQYYCRYKIRRYGFHGTSHRYVTLRYQQITGKKPIDTNIISLHLGNGASACAIKGGKSIDTSMGLTPTEGLVMGTRCGDLDPAILDFIAHKEALSLTEIMSILNKQSGLQGLSGLTNDMRELVEEAKHNKDRRAQLAIDIFATRVKKYIGAYLAEMGGADALVFTGGIGENNVDVRELVCTGLEKLGLQLDKSANNKAVGLEGTVSLAQSPIKIYVIPTNEELLIARDTFACIQEA